MRVTLSALLVTTMAVAAAVRPEAVQTPERVDFARDVQPILRANCYGCHGAALQSGNFRLDRRRDSMPNRVGANGARIVPGSSERSRLYLKVSGSEAGLRMPPSGPLPSEDIQTLKAWIEQGADWPDALAGETPSPPQDPVATQLLDAIRRGDRRTIDSVLSDHPKAARAPGTGGITPLMYAVLYGDMASARRILELDADVNARNDAGATALMWAVDDAAATRLLLERGADPKMQSADGRTALMLAVARSGQAEVVKLLLDRGATVSGQTLGFAAAAGDAATVRLLIERGANPATVPNDLGLRAGCDDCLAQLLPAAPRPALTRALETAARYGDSARMRQLLERGAEPTPLALRSAAAAEAVPVDGINELLNRGARDEQALDLAIRHGDTAVVAALRKAGFPQTPSPAVDAPKASTPRPARDAVTVSLPLLQHADAVFLKTAGCISCHNNSLFQMTAASARRRGFKVDEAIARDQTARMRAYLESWRERELQDIPIPGGIDTTSYILAGLAAEQYPPDPATDALARYVLRRQFADGSWHIASHRPPIEASDVEVTAMAVRALQTYAPPTKKAEYAAAIRRGGVWLTQAQPKTTEDHVFLVLGLGWASVGQDAIKKAADALLRLQRADGGWGQLPTLGSDAYATGQALAALAESGAVKPTDAAYQKGVRFLLGTQLADGSWHTRSRAVPIQPYFDSEFPHAKDQFISAAATNWATMALIAAVR